MKRYSDFSATTSQLPGDKVTIEQVLNKEIEIHGFRVYKSKYKKNETGEYLTIQFRYPDSKPDQFMIIFTGSDVLINQARDAEAELPFVAKIVKVNRYYSFS